MLSLLINFLLGVSWGFALIGASILFINFLQVGIVYAIFGALIGALPFLFLVVILEYIILKQNILSELKKQTKLLEELKEKE
jgi:hypothetical protein